MASYEDEKKQILKWINMIDAYLLEPNNINQEWIKCLKVCRVLLKKQLLQQANSLYAVLNYNLQNFYLEMKDRWMREDYQKKTEITKNLAEAIKEYETVYDKVPEYKYIDDVFVAKRDLDSDIKEIEEW